MSTENLADRKYVPTQPYDSTDPPRFGQLVETTKDAFASELKKFFDYKVADANTKITETPNIQKFAIGATGNESNLENSVDLVMAYADTPDEFPMVAITSTILRERKLGIGDSFVTHVQYAPSIISSIEGPYDLTDGWTLEFKTWPGGASDSETTSTITFDASLFSSMTAVTTAELCSAINRTQALYYNLEPTSDDKIRISTGGPCGLTSPNYIEITGGDTDCLNTLGFVIGDSDTYLNTDNPPKNRYVSCGDMTVSVDIVTDDLNTRTELADLVYNFFTFYMEKRRFQFIGRSYQERGLDPAEWFHIIFQSQFNWSAELNTTRYGGETYDYIYARRGSIPVFAADYIDRDLVTPPVFLERDNVRPELYNEIPNGDYFGKDWIKYNNKLPR